MQSLPPVGVVLTPEQRAALAQIALVYVSASSRRTPEFAARRMKELFGVDITEAELREAQSRLLTEAMRELSDLLNRGRS